MGIPRGTARLLLDEARARPFGGSLLELGRMAVYATRAELERWAREQSSPLAPVADPALSHQPELAAAGCVDDRTFFRLLGCEHVESADVSDWEGADHVFDLNLPVPAELAGRFDTVFEAGTLQHIFDLPQVFANLHALLKEGGRVIHGTRVTEDDFTLVLREADGTLRSLDKATLRRLRKIPGQSPMPSFAATFTATELDDLVAYLAGRRGAP